MLYLIAYYGTAAVLGFIIALFYLILTSPYQKGPLKKLIREDPKVDVAENRKKKGEKPKCQIYRAIDDVIESVVDNIFRDYFDSWFTTLTSETDSKETCDILKQHTYALLKNLYLLVLKIDPALFLCNKLTPVLTEHVKQMNSVSFDVHSGQNVRSLQVHVCLENEKAEDEHLRKLASILLNLCAPEDLVSSEITQVLVRELITKYLLHGVVDSMSQPEFINRAICNYLKHEDTKKAPKEPSYRTINEFIQEINSIYDVERLQSKVDRIVSEINQATMLQIVKEENRKKGYKLKKNDSASIISATPVRKADQMMARDLPQYIANLNRAKSRAEKRIIQLGGTVENPTFTGLINEGSKKTPFRELALANEQNHVLPASLKDILKCEKGFALFQNFMETEFNQSNWTKFWREVEILKKEPSSQQHQRADKIFHEFVHFCTDPNFKLPPEMAESMHQYVLGNSSIHAFLEAQAFVAKHLERRFLPGFLVNAGYKKWLVIQEQKKDSTIEQALMASGRTLRSRAVSVADSMQVAENEVTKLNELRDKIMRKNLVIRQMEESAIKREPKLLRELKTEVFELTRQADTLETLIDDMNAWFNNKGRYAVSVTDCQSATNSSSNEPVFSIELYIGQSENDMDPRSGLTISRTLTDITQLHADLLPMLPWTKEFSLPKVRRIRSYSVEYFKEAKLLVDAYLSVLVSDPVAFDNERLFNFFRDVASNQPGNGNRTSIESNQTFAKKFTSGVTKVGKLFLADIDSDSVENDDLHQGELVVGGDTSALSMTAEEVFDHDALAEPLFKLIDEVFELRGMLKVFRQSLMSFLRNRYHITLSKRIRDYVNWIFSDQLLRHYFEMFRDSWWPNGKQASSQPANSNLTEEDKETLRNQAVNLICKWVHNNRDDVYCLALGEKNLTRGVVKVFTCFQERTFNKHLIIRIIETFLRELLVNLKEAKDADVRVVTSCNMSFQLT